MFLTLVRFAPQSLYTLFVSKRLKSIDVIIPCKYFTCAGRNSSENDSKLAVCISESNHLGGNAFSDVLTSQP